MLELYERRWVLPSGVRGGICVSRRGAPVRWYPCGVADGKMAGRDTRAGRPVRDAVAAASGGRGSHAREAGLPLWAQCHRRQLPGARRKEASLPPHRALASRRPRALGGRAGVAPSGGTEAEGHRPRDLLRPGAQSAEPSDPARWSAAGASGDKGTHPASSVGLGRPPAGQKLSRAWEARGGSSSARARR
jgi:hypothetical protein